MEETTQECEVCHHVYTETYGRWIETAGGSVWKCHHCANKKLKRTKSSDGLDGLRRLLP